MKKRSKAEGTQRDMRAARAAAKDAGQIQKASAVANWLCGGARVAGTEFWGEIRDGSEQDYLVALLRNQKDQLGRDEIVVALHLTGPWDVRPEGEAPVYRDQPVDDQLSMLRHLARSIVDRAEIDSATWDLRLIFRDGRALHIAGQQQPWTEPWEIQVWWGPEKAQGCGVSNSGYDVSFWTPADFTLGSEPT